MYLVGGPVRDVLLGTSVRDLDFVVEGDGPEVARRLSVELGGEVVAHDRFGTSTLLKSRSRVDVVTARREVYPHPGALPQVSPGAISDDLARRDFSINALALPLAMDRPELLDPHGGIGDVNQGLIRVLHPESFVDDPTRIFRAVRYEQRLAFRIEDRTQTYLRDAIDQGRIACLTSDRLRHELERILQEDRPDLALSRALELGALAAIHPSLGDSLAGARLKAIARVNSARRESQMGGIGPLTYIAGLTYPLTRRQAEEVIHRLNMPNAWARPVRDVIALREQEEDIAAPHLLRSRLVSLVEGFSADAVLAVSLLTDSSTVAERLTEYLNELKNEAPALNGNDLLALGVPAGPRVGQILAKLREARLDGETSTEEDERRLVQEILTREKGISEHGRRD